VTASDFPVRRSPAGTGIGGDDVPARRLLLVHAHPDDECTTTGAAMARYVAEGAGVTRVTCTRGEEGEVLVEELAHLAASAEDRLGEHRETELTAAMKVLGVTDFRFLGAPGEYRDSGMAGTPPNEHPAAFCRAPVDEPAARLAAVVREVRPQVLVTYDPQGGYLHPDHVQAHRVAMRSIELAADPQFGSGEPWQVAKVYWCAFEESAFRELARRWRESGQAPEDLDPDGEMPPFVVPDDKVSTVVEGAEWGELKIRALLQYPTQVPADDPFFGLNEPEAVRFWGREAFLLARGTAVPDPNDPRGKETDLFAGVA
jgi:N-acetyl-1-D-myo-inositol-2-amino-2-deoxy-alpha-D-glucopyranoside deacetylase